MINESNIAWLLFVAEGSYDDFRVNLIGYFADEIKARDKFNGLAAILDAYKAENRKPEEKEFMVKRKVDHIAYSNAIKAWRNKCADNDLFEVKYYVLEKWADGDSEFLKQYKSFYHSQTF